MWTFQQAIDRVLVLMSAGNLAITQAVVNLLQESPESLDGQPLIYQASNMFNAARVVGDALRAIHQRDAESLKEQGHEFNGTFILGGQIKGEEPRLFHIYSAGNFIESSVDTPYFQIGESKYGKPSSTASSPAAAACRKRPSALWCQWIRPSAPTSPWAPAGSRHHPARRVQARHSHQHRYGQRIFQNDSHALGLCAQRSLQRIAQSELVVRRLAIRHESTCPQTASRR